MLIVSIIIGICLFLFGFLLGNWNYQFRIAKYKLIQFIWYVLNRVDEHSQNQILTVIKHYRGYKYSKITEIISDELDDPYIGE